MKLYKILSAAASVILLALFVQFFVDAPNGTKWSIFVLIVLGFPLLGLLFELVKKRLQ